MKQVRFSREGTLKGLLLFALVGSLTWEPIAKQFSELELASSQTTARLDCRDQKNSAHPACKVATADQRNQIVAQSKQLEAEHGATDNRTSAKPKPGNTEAKATESCEGCLEVENTKLKAELAQLKKLSVKIEGSTSTTVSKVDAQTRTSSRPLIEQIKNCEVAADGDELTEIEELRCQTKLLATLKSSDSSRRKEITRKIEDLVTGLRKDARENVMSKDEDSRNKGERLITELLAALKTVRFDRDSKRTEMIDSLEALRVGAQARVAAADLEEDVADLETEMKSTFKDLNKLTRDFQNSCRSRTGCDRDIYDQLQDQSTRVGELREEHHELAETINDEQDEAVDTLEDYRESMTRTEIRDYTSPFTKLKSRMETMVDARKLGASTVGNQTAVDGRPSDFDDVRNGNSALRRDNGMQVPTITQVPGQVSGQLPMGSPQSINTQIGQQQYTPQYMQVPGVMQGQPGGSLLPSPGGAMMNGGMPQMQNGGSPVIVPVGGQQFGQHNQYNQFGPQQVLPPQGQQYGGAPQILPAPRY